MDCFDLAIDYAKFRSTNGVWNDLKLNAPSNIGYVSKLIFDKKFTSKEAWRDYYYESGEVRLEALKKISSDKLEAVSNGDLSKLTSLEKNLFYKYGRTKSELDAIGRIMYQEIVKNGNSLNLTLPECKYSVQYRVIGETWNGIVMQEINTIETLKKSHPEFTYLKTSEIEDLKYEVDYEVYLGNTLLCGVQIKPLSYMTSTLTEVDNVKLLNIEKNKEYERIKQAKVYYVYSNRKGEVQHIETYQELETFLRTVTRIENSWK